MGTQESDTTKQINHHHHSTYKLIEHYCGKVMHVVGQPGDTAKRVSKELQGDAKHVRTTGQAYIALAQEQIWHDQQQEQAGPC